MTDLGDIRRLIGPRKRHVIINLEAAKEMKERPIDGDLEQLLDETRDRRDRLQQHLTVYQRLRVQLEAVAKLAGKPEHDKVMKDYEEYVNLVLEAEEFVGGLRSKMAMIKDRMDFKLQLGTSKVNFELEEKMLEVEQQKAEIEHRKLQIETERLTLEREKLRKKLEVDTKQGTKPNIVKLPKLDFKKFSGGLLNWQGFWDSFNSAIHSNPSLSPVEKLNYLRAQLEGDAADVISGLPLTNANYEQSIKLLKERYGQNEVIINVHYTSLMDLPVSSGQTSALRKNYDLIERHLRSLEALGENIESKILVSLIMAKLPKDVRIHLTDQKNDGDEWTVQLLRDQLHRYISNRENADRQTSCKVDYKGSVGNMWSTSQVTQFDSNTTTSALLSEPRLPQNLTGKKKMICIYCSGQHWSDECQTFPTVTARKEKIKGHCFICLKQGHQQKNYTVKKACVYCKQRNRHHRSLCIKKFLDEKSSEMAHPVTEPLSATVATEHTLLSSDEQVLMQTATVEVENLQKSRKVTTRLLLDTGSQRTYITNELAGKLQLPITRSEILTVYTFSASKPRELHTPVTELQLLTKDGSSLHLRVNVVPKTTGNLQRAYFNSEKFTHLLKDIPLADSIPSTKETSNIELLIGNDYYCDIFSGDIAMKVVSPGLNLMESKLGWILTGRVKCQDDKPDSSVSMLTYTSSPSSVHLSAHADDKHPLAEQKTQLEEFWKLETLGIREPVQENEDDKALQKFNETIHLEDGRY